MNFSELLGKVQWLPRGVDDFSGVCHVIGCLAAAYACLLAAFAGAWPAVGVFGTILVLDAQLWRAWDARVTAEAKLAARRVEFRIDVPESSVVVINHQNRGTATIVSPGKAALN